MVSLLHLILGFFQPRKEYPNKEYSNKEERVASPALLLTLFTFNLSFASINLLFFSSTL
jgi:hypothetical protein